MNFSWLFDGLNSTENITNNDFTTDDEDEEEYEDLWYDFEIRGKTYMACILFIALVGVAGNVMSFILMMDTKVSSFAYSIYIKWMAVSDSVLLVLVSTEDSLDTYSRDDLFTTYDVILCKVWHFAKSMTFTLSPWLVVALTLDRFVCVVFPLSRHVLCTRSKAIQLCCSMTVVTATLNIDRLIFMRIEENTCVQPYNPELGRYELFRNLVLKSTLPCVFVLILNIATISRIRQSLSFRKQFTKVEKEREDKVTLPLLLVSGFAFVTLVPRSVTEVVEILYSVFQPDGVGLILANSVWPIFNVIFLMNFAQNFFILIASWPEYRTIMKDIFSRSKAKKQTKSSQSPSTEISETCVSTMADAVSMTSRKHLQYKTRQDKNILFS